MLTRQSQGKFNQFKSIKRMQRLIYANHENAVLPTEEKLYLPCLPPHPVVVPAVLITVRINAGHDVEVEPFEQAPEWKTRNPDDGHRQISGGNPPYERSSDFG